MRRREYYRWQRLSDVKHQRVRGDKKLLLNLSDSVMWKEQLLSERQWSEKQIRCHPGTQYQFHRASPTTHLRVETEICCYSTSPSDRNITYLHSIATFVKYCLNLKCFQKGMYWNLDPQCITVLRRDLGELSELWGLWSYYWLNPLIVSWLYGP